MTIYTELLEAAMRVAEDAERMAPTADDAAAWKELNTKCRREMYLTRGKIDSIRKKDLTRKKQMDTMRAHSKDAANPNTVVCEFKHRTTK